ncbi:MAG TPA: hypothetical protein VMB81_01250 [Candidatus Sulfotelmatobacter sp.]|nr:hypothetical protein [Candidatus Sulfotelmatobacter sp.]
MLLAEDGAIFRMRIESGPERVRVSWTVVQGSGEAALTETDSHDAASVEEARRWAHQAARVRGFKKIRVRKTTAPEAEPEAEPDAAPDA